MMFARVSRARATTTEGFMMVLLVYRSLSTPPVETGEFVTLPREGYAVRYRERIDGYNVWSWSLPAAWEVVQGEVVLATVSLVKNAKYEIETHVVEREGKAHTRLKALSGFTSLDEATGAAIRRLAGAPARYASSQYRGFIAKQRALAASPGHIPDPVPTEGEPEWSYFPLAEGRVGLRFG